MGGRTKQIVYQYTDTGKYLRKWDSISEVRERYYPVNNKNNNKYPIFRTGLEVYVEMPDGSYICKERIGRDNLMYHVKRDKDPFIQLADAKRKNFDKPLEAVNGDGIVVGEFINLFIFEKLTGKSGQNLIHSHTRLGTKRPRKLPPLGFYLRYKEQ